VNLSGSILTSTPTGTPSNFSEISKVLLKAEVTFTISVADLPREISNTGAPSHVLYILSNPYEEAGSNSTLKAGIYGIGAGAGAGMVGVTSGVRDGVGGVAIWTP